MATWSKLAAKTFLFLYNIRSNLVHCVYVFVLLLCMYDDVNIIHCLVNQKWKGGCKYLKLIILDTRTNG